MAYPLRYFPPLSSPKLLACRSTSHQQFTRRPQSNAFCLQHKHPPVSVLILSTKSRTALFFCVDLHFSPFSPLVYLRHNIVHLSLLSQVAYFKSGSIGQENRKHALSLLFPKLALIANSSDPCREQKEFFTVDVRLNHRWFFCCCVLYFLLKRTLHPIRFLCTSHNSPNFLRAGGRTNIG